MAYGLKRSDVPQIRRVLGFYRVMAFITGAFLLLLVVEMGIKYLPGFQLLDGSVQYLAGAGYELELNGPSGFLALSPADTLTGTNLSLLIQIVHGNIYVLYLISDFLLWQKMRWSFTRFILIAAGGVVPFLSFVVEARIARQVRETIARLEAPRRAGSDGATAGDRDPRPIDPTTTTTEATT
jgi:integral membrane protein